MLLLESMSNGYVIGSKFRECVQSECDSRLCVISPYISEIDDFDFSELVKFHPVNILCNIENPSCNPFVVEAMIRFGCCIKYRSDIHAKAYIFKDRAILCSANFTNNGIGNGNYDCGVYVDKKEGCTSINEWFNQLWNERESKRIEDLNMTDWARLKSKWNARSSIKQNKLPHFVDLLFANELEGVSFIFWRDFDVNSTKEIVKKSASSKKYDLPDDGEEWDYWVEEECDSRSKSKIKNSVDELLAKYNDQEVISLECKMDKNDRITKFLKATPFLIRLYSKSITIEIERNKYEVVSLYKIIKSKRFACTKDKEKKYESLIEKLNNSIEQNGRIWDNYMNTVDGKFGYCTIQQLQELIKNVG